MADRKGSPLKGAGFFVVPRAGRPPIGPPPAFPAAPPPAAFPGAGPQVQPPEGWGGGVRLTAAAIDHRLAEQVRRPRLAAAEEAALARRVGEEIGRRRVERGWSQGELATAVGCDRSAVCRWERGQRLPSVVHLVELGRAFGCGARALIPDGVDGVAES